MPSRPETMMVRRAQTLSATVWAVSLALSLAWPVALTAPGWAQDLDEGKSAAQLFSSNCAVCHKSVKDLSKSAQGGGLQGFLRQHYTTGVDMAKMLAAYVNASGGAASRDTREAARPATPVAPRTVELPPRRPDSEAGEGERREPRRSAAVAPADGGPDRAKSGAKPDAARPEPAEATLPLAADLAPVRATAAPNAAVAQAQPVEARPTDAKPAETGPAEASPAR